ncbi:isochorismatase family protein [Herbaspirillum lusitanum]|uniref:Isochorismatase family protein n=1 Tax=Herbaspirillum lusitanum TaxID=213312 RepID=A0ABW9A2P0_9BURK
MHTKFLRCAVPLSLLLALSACNTTPMSGGAAPASDLNAGVSVLPAIPAPATVALDASTTALLILDINSVICQPNPACMATVPAIASLLQKARAAKVPVLYSSTQSPAGVSPALPDIAPQGNEPTVVSRANKFTGTALEELLRQRNARTLVIVGSAANGAVLYSAFHANTRGFTVVVAEDGLSSPVPINTTLARYQMLNQAGFYNSNNTPLADQRVTLSRSELISFK